MKDLGAIRDKIIEKLIKTDAKFSKDYESHRALDQEARELGEMTVRTPDEETRLRKIKKRKLGLKDRIEHKINDLIHSDTLQ